MVHHPYGSINHILISSFPFFVLLFTNAFCVTNLQSYIFIINYAILFNPNRSLGLVVFRIFRRMNFVCLLMSDSELLRIKNKQKASYKNRKTARSNLKKSFHVLMTDLGLCLFTLFTIGNRSISLKRHSICHASTRRNSASRHPQAVVAWRCICR